jgi:serine/threonine-protein kinase RsbW
VEETLVLSNRLEELGRLARWLHGLAQAWDLEPEAVQAMDLALEEVVVNVMDHAYGPGIDLPIRVSLSREGDLLRARVEDRGPAYDPLGAPAPPDQSRLLESAPGGMGVFLARRLMDDMTWERRGDLNVLTVARRLGGRGRERA